VFEEVGAPGNVRDAWWGVQMKRFDVAKTAVPRALINGVEDRSHGHLNWFPDMSRYVALFIHKALLARLGSTVSEPAGLRNVPFESGWLADPTETQTPAPPWLGGQHGTDRSQAGPISRKPTAISAISCYFAGRSMTPSFNTARHCRTSPITRKPITTWATLCCNPGG
jgi:hypothetical protein